MEGVIISIKKAISGEQPDILEEVSSKDDQLKELLEPVKEYLKSKGPKNEAEQRLLEVINEIL